MMTEERTAVDAETGTFKVRDTTRTIEFEGVHLAHVSTETPDSPRWSVFDLYRVDDGRYVVVITGQSTVFHRHDSDCNTGVPTRLDMLPPDAEPCSRCLPGADAEESADDLVDMEEDYRNVTVCANHAEVEMKLRARHDGSPGPLSRPAMRLLGLAAVVDPAFDASGTVERL